MYHQYFMHSSTYKQKNKIKQRRFSLDLPPLSLLFPVDTMALHRYMHDKRGQGKRQKKKKERKEKKHPKHKSCFNNPRPVPFARDNLHSVPYPRDIRSACWDPRDIRLARWDPPRVSPPSPNRYDRHSPSSS